jgi:hypothetical protein
VSVPDHWTRTNARVALTMPLIEDIAMSADHYDWENGDGDLKIAALYETTDDDNQIDYAFPNEMPPPHPDQLPLISAGELPA